MELEALSPRAPQIQYQLPTDLLISASQIKALTEDTRLTVGNKSVEVLKNENACLQLDIDRNDLKIIHDEDVMKELTAEGSEYENMAGLSNTLASFESQMADLLLKMDASDAAAVQRSPRQPVVVVKREEEMEVVEVVEVEKGERR